MIRSKKHIIIVTLISLLLSFSILYWAGIFSENGNQTYGDENMNEHSLVMWNQTYGAISTDFAHSLVETSDGGFALTGYTRDWDNPGKDDDFWLVKTEPNGNIPELPFSHLILTGRFLKSRF